MKQVESPLTVDFKERSILIELLNAELDVIRQEVTHTETASFKDNLKQRENALQGILAKLV